MAASLPASRCWTVLDKSDAEVSVDLFERVPAPFGLIRYGVAPDHPRIKGIVTALHKVLDRPNIRLLGNIDYGTDIKLDELREFYDAVIFSTGASSDRALDIPGRDLPGSFGAADFVSWYDGHPDVPRTWPLTATSVAVLGVGNVALDVARILAKTADELLSTDIPPNVYEGSIAALRSSKQIDMVVKTLQEWAIRDQGDRPKRLHLHFFHSPTEVLGTDAVTGLRTERTELTGDGTVRGTGEFHDWDVQAVYRAVGYLSSPLAEIPFDHAAGTVPNNAGRVLDIDENQVPGVYVTGWIKRGPVGLIGHTKGDAAETIASLLADAETLTSPGQPEPDAILGFLAERGIPFTTWEGWGKLDAHERSLGEPQARERVKVVDRDEMTRVSRY